MFKQIIRYANACKKKTAAAIFLFICANAFAENDNDVPSNVTSVYGNMSAEVLVSPRSAALAASDLAVNPAGPLASNPAVVAQTLKPTLHLAYSSYYGNVFSATRGDYLTPLNENSALAATIGYLLIPGIEDTRGVDIGALDNADIKTFSAHDLWTRVAYGHKFESRRVDFYAGAATTLRYRNLGDRTAYGIGADVGVLATFKEPSFHAGLLWENVSSGHVGWSSDGGESFSEEVPQHVRVSLAYEREDPYIYGRFALFYTSPDLLSNEGINYYDETLDSEEERLPSVRKLSDGVGYLFSSGRFGVEYVIMQTLALRVGLVRAGSESSYTMGAGLILFSGRAGADICYASHELDGSVMLGVFYRW